MTIYYSDSYRFPLPEGHRFPISKYGKLREALSRDVANSFSFIEAPMLQPEELFLAHDPDYVLGFLEGRLDSKAIRRIGLPYSPEFARRTLASAGGTVKAAEKALEDGIAGNLAGGTHHAFREYGEGFCVFNDIAVAGLRLLDEGQVNRIGIIDLDVHQGNGTAAIVAGDPRFFTLDMYGRHNYPFRKVPTTLEVPLENETGDDEYLALLEEALPRLFGFNPDILFYQAGVDVLAADSLGKLSLTCEGVAERDRIVLRAAADYEIPIVLTLGGGYSKPIDASVEAYAGTYRVAGEVFSFSH
ncbi:MAG: histone deacetylase [Candidatus Kapaibacterium sp.]